MVKGVYGRGLCVLLAMTAFCMTGCVREESAGELLEEVLTQVPAELPKEEEQADISFLNESASAFCYERLSEAEQLWYRDIEQALGEMSGRVRLSEEGFVAGLDETLVDKIFQCVLNDHPEIFYVDGYTYTKYTKENRTIAIAFAGTYRLTMEEAAARKAEIEQAAERLLAGISPAASEYDKVKYVFDTLILNTDYDHSAEDNQNIYSVLVGGRSVCQGYAKATQYLLNRLGVECTLVQGTVDNGEGHAWNMVRVDGSFYYVDTTWGDASYRLDGLSPEEAGYIPEINYDYLCVTTKQLVRTHTINSYVPLPECTATEANYYVRKNALFDKYDEKQLEELFAAAQAEGQQDITVKCASVSCFKEMKERLIDRQGIFDYLSAEQGKVSYAHNEKQLSLTFWVTNQ